MNCPALPLRNSNPTTFSTGHPSATTFRRSHPTDRSTSKIQCRGKRRKPYSNTQHQAKWRPFFLYRVARRIDKRSNVLPEAYCAQFMIPSNDKKTHLVKLKLLMQGYGKTRHALAWMSLIWSLSASSSNPVCALKNSVSSGSRESCAFSTKISFLDGKSGMAVQMHWSSVLSYLGPAQPAACDIHHIMDHACHYYCFLQCAHTHVIDLYSHCVIYSNFNIGHHNDPNSNEGVGAATASRLRDLGQAGDT